MPRALLILLAALAIGGAVPVTAEAASRLPDGTQLARAGIGTSHFGGGHGGFGSRPSYRRSYRGRGYGHGFGHGLFTGWFFSHFFGYGFGFGFPLWPFLLILLFAWMSRRGRRGGYR